MSGQEPVKLISEDLPVASTEDRWTTCLYAAATKFIQHVANGEALLDIILRVEFATRIDGVPIFFDSRCRQGNVSGDNEISRAEQLNDLVIGDVEPGAYNHRGDIGRDRGVHRLIGNQSKLHFFAIGCPKQDLFYNPGAGVSIDPYLHLCVPFFCIVNRE